MAVLDPFANLIPPESQRLTIYWYCTALRAVYFNNLVLSQQVNAVAGGTSVLERPGYPPLAPTVQGWVFAPDRAILIPQGTTQWSEYVAEALGSLLIATSPWAGRISQYFAAVAVALVAPFLELLQAGDVGTWRTAGHSLGGAASSLLLNLFPSSSRPTFLFDIGAPRSGDATHAFTQQAQPVPRLRVTAAGDPVPLVPPALGPSVISALPAAIWAVPATSYFHWGVRWHLDFDGSATLPAEIDTVVESAEYLAGVVSGSTGWYDSHNTSEYARRVRAGIPVPFPIGAPVPDFPGLDQLDALNIAMNESEGIDWPVTAWIVPQPGLPIFPPAACGGTI